MKGAKYWAECREAINNLGRQEKKSSCSKKTSVAHPPVGFGSMYGQAPPNGHFFPAMHPTYSFHHFNHQQFQPPSNAQPMISQPMNATQMNAPPMNAQPMNATQMNAQPMNAQPMNAQPMNATQMNAQPMNAQPINFLPPLAFDDSDADENDVEVSEEEGCN